ncbi:MAG: hypothetical protein ACT4PZ_19700 [Panacagrimonas sp.]
MGLVLLLAFFHDARAQPAASPIPISAQMRDTGYVLGDFIEQRVDLALPGSAELVRDSIPALGRVNNWMELREVRRPDDDSLVLTYQVFAAVEQALQLAVPPFKLRVREGAEELTITVPAQPFYLSAVLPPTLGETDRQPRLTPAPEPLPEQAPLWRALAWAALALVLTLYLAWAYDRLPFLSRNAGPLTRLNRSLRRKAGTPLSGETYGRALQEVHAAFNACAQETLYESTLPVLFARAPHLLPLRPDIETLFAHSRQVFYGAAHVEPWPTPQLLDLCRRARDCERGLGAGK